MKTNIVLFLSLLIISVKVMADDRFTSIRLESNYSFTEIESTDTNNQKSRLLSKSNPGISVSLAEHWNSKNTTSIKFYYNQLSLKKSEGAEIEGLEQTLTSFGVTHNYSYSDNLRFALSGMFTEELYLRSKSASSLTLDKFLNPQLKLDTEYDLFKTSNLTFGTALNLDVSAPFTAEKYESTEGNYSVDASLGFGGAVYGRKFFKNYSLEGSVFIKNKSATTSTTTQNTLNQGVSLRIAIPFGYEK